MARKTTSSRNANAAPHIGRSLKRFLGLIACGGLVAASVWINGQTNAQETVSEKNPFERSKSGSSAGVTSSKSAKANDVNRRRVEDQMRQARLDLRNGDNAEATRRATEADQMARKWKVTFKDGEQTPAALLSLIQGPTQDSQVARSKSKSGIQQASATDDPHAYVQGLLAEAREDVRRGELNNARQKIELASATEVEYGKSDLRPEQVLADLERKQTASPKGPSAAFEAATKAPQPSWNEPTSPKAVAKKQTPPSSPKDLKSQAKDLVARSREALENGQLEEARDLAMEAQKLDVSYGLLDEHPEHVLAEIERRSKSVVIDGNRRKVTPAASSDATQEDHDTALRLLSEAKQSLRSGNLKEAREKTEQASQLNVAYAIFDDRPDLILQEVRAAESRAAALASGKASPSATPEKDRAVQLITSARLVAEIRRREESSGSRHRSRDPRCHL